MLLNEKYLKQIIFPSARKAAVSHRAGDKKRELVSSHGMGYIT